MLVTHGYLAASSRVRDEQLLANVMAADCTRP